MAGHPSDASLNDPRQTLQVLRVVGASNIFSHEVIGTNGGENGHILPLQHNQSHSQQQLLRREEDPGGSLLN